MVNKPTYIKCPELDELYKEFPDVMDFGAITSPRADILQGRAYGVAYLNARDQHFKLVGAVEARERVCNELGESLEEMSEKIDVIVDTLGKKVDKNSK